eukprot:2428433-Pleurochrysis_carterae.AAC.1
MMPLAQRGISSCVMVTVATLGTCASLPAARSRSAATAACPPPGTMLGPCPCRPRARTGLRRQWAPTAMGRPRRHASRGWAGPGAAPGACALRASCSGPLSAG